MKKNIKPNSLKLTKNKKGFTLIELILVVAIIGLLASIVIMSLGNYMTKTSDTKRFSDIAQIQKALAMYYNDHGEYPNISANGNTRSDSSSWAVLAGLLDEYLVVLPEDPVNEDGFAYYYESDGGDDHQTYGMMFRVENISNLEKAKNDGGYYNYNDGKYYEVGSQPVACMAVYGPGIAGRWWHDNNSTMDYTCYGGDL